MKTIEYYFELIDGTAKLNYPADRKFTEALQPKFYTPQWAKKVIWYQIMLDRFFNGDVANDPPNTLPWTFDFAPDKKHPSEKGKFYEVVWGRNFGGDLQGLIKKLPYLKELGITGIYLTPVFEAESYHKYNTADYRHIDDNFGMKYSAEEIERLRLETEDPETWFFTETDKLFLKFLKQAHALGIKVIIDGVFNHSGEDFFAFKDLKRNLQNSKYKDWYMVTDWEVFKRSANIGKGYVGWAGFGGLPEYAEDASGLVPGIKEHIFNISRRWLDPNGDGNPEDGIDGWRLDVPDCIKQPFWVDWCKLVKSINPEAYIVGELWSESPVWLKPELFHAQMNYPFAKLLLNFIIDESLTPTQFDQSLHKLINLYPMQVNFVQMNLLDSHDTDRLASMIYNPHRSYDKKNRL
ncbi:MAG: alpha-amylase family glycosyl hydrolase, partial [Elusimicrobiota bacterium]|nr:alpha-amylase family glycosyl hydrolase [Elusimicrobiota bacterium]